MGNRRKQDEALQNDAWAAQFIACLGGLAVLYYAESTMSDLQKPEDRHIHQIPSWQIHMGSICIGVLAFVCMLFCLEFLARRSKIAAWRLSWPWLPLIGLTGLATLIHFPIYVVLPAIAIHVIWAYRRIRAVR
jgi:hypothetical protein